MAWETGIFTQAGNTTLRYWWGWGEGDPGQEVIGVHPITPNAELRYIDPGVILNPNCSLTYFITIRNMSSSPATFRFRGNAI